MENLSAAHDSTGQTNASTPPPFSKTCPRCGQPVDMTHAFCPHCGDKQNRGTAWYYHPVWISVLAFAVLGPFAIPLVWKSPRMGNTAKGVMTVAIVVYTAWCLYTLYEVLAIDLKQFEEVDRLFQQIKHSR